MAGLVLGQVGVAVAQSDARAGGLGVEPSRTAVELSSGTPATVGWTLSCGVPTGCAGARAVVSATGPFELVGPAAAAGAEATRSANGTIVVTFTTDLGEAVAGLPAGTTPLVVEVQATSGTEGPVTGTVRVEVDATGIGQVRSDVQVDLPAPPTTTTAPPTTAAPDTTEVPPATGVTATSTPTTTSTPGPTAPTGGTTTTTPVLLGGRAAAGLAELTISKTASATTLQPGQEVEYRVAAACSSLVEPCTDFTISDTLPAELEVTSLPQSNSLREVTFDAGTRVLTVRYKVPLQGGGTGLEAGGSQAVTVGMRLPALTPVVDGTTITNSAEATATNAPTVSDAVDLTAAIPVNPVGVATKSWTSSTGVALSDTPTTVRLGARNGSSASTRISEVAVADTTVATFERFDVTSVGTVVAYPLGADRVALDVCLKPITAAPCAEGEWTSFPGQSGAVPLVLSAGPTDLADVVGVRYRFSAADGSDLPYDPTGGRVDVGLQLRSTLRSTGAPLNPSAAQRVDNCAGPSVTQQDTAVTRGTDACARFTIQPGTVSVGAAKTMFPDSDGDFRSDGFVVVGQNSGISMRITGTNNSAYPVPVMQLTEPGTTSVTEFDKIDVTTARLTFPTGATGAVLKVTCRGGSQPVDVNLTAPPTVVTRTNLGCDAGVFPASVSVSYTGSDTVTGEPLLAIGAQGLLELHGTAPRVTTADVTDKLQNCADVYMASRPDGTGAATAIACAQQTVENPRPDVGNGVKSTSGVTTITPGQALAFNLSFKNTGNIPVTNVVLVDPPDPTAAGNPFGLVRLTGLAATTATPASTLEVYDPTVGGYVPYAAGNAALLQRATGIRVTATGNVPVGATFTVAYNVVVRDSVDPTAVPRPSFTNCAAVGVNTPKVSSPFCASRITAETPGAAANLNKFLSPGTVVRPQPGVAEQVVTVKHATQNTGTLYLKRLIVTDTDADFFDAVVFKGNIQVNFPAGANRVQVDACTSVASCAAGTFVNGTRTSSSNPGLPAGVVAANVKGLRITFTSSTNGYTILPAPTPQSNSKCVGAAVCFDVAVREFLASDGTTPVPDRLNDTSSGAAESELQPSGTTFAVPEVSSSVDVVKGIPKINLVKGPDSRIGPGDSAPLNLVLTNTGTDAITGPTIVDPLPANLTFDPVIAGAPAGQPYIVRYTLPTGVAPPAAATFTALKGDPTSPPVPGCTDVNRVCKLVWTFSPGWTLPPGGKIEVQFNVTLTPGVVAGQTITNNGGASGTNPDLACDRSTTVTGNASFGTGTFCTDSATVTTLAGDNFTTEKWIKADPSLGFLTASGAVVAVTSAECPQYRVSGAVYTRFPCTARVLPGQQVDYLVRGVNSGTNPAKQVVLVDGLPVRGDTGVLLSGQARGTQWANRPTMLTPVANLDGYSGVVTDYTTNTFPGSSFCTANLRPAPNNTCPAGSFSAGFGSDVTGFRTTMTFPDSALLQPGQSFSLTWSMQAPASPGSTGNEPVAWNSIAYKPTFRLPGGGTTSLPATEPLKVGVSMPLGALAVTKTVTGLPAGITLPAFGLAYSCRVELTDGSTTEVAGGSFTLVDGGTFGSGSIPQGAQCRVWETDPQGGTSPFIGEPNAAAVTIDPATGIQRVDLTNAYDAGEIRLTKGVVWDNGVGPVTIPGRYQFEVTCAFPTFDHVLPGYPTTLSLAEGETATLSDLPVGTACLATETDAQGATTVQWRQSGRDPQDGEAAFLTAEAVGSDAAAATVENTYTTGGVKIVKQLDGAASQWAQGPFTFRLVCTDPAGVLPELVRTATLGPTDLSTTVSPIPTGFECSITETGLGDASSAVLSPATPVTIPPVDPPTGPVEVTATNDFPTGSVTVAKVLAGGAAALMADARFTLRVQCERDLLGGAGAQTIVDTTVRLRGGETTTLPDIVPIGARCWATETDTIGATTVSIDHDETDKILITGANPAATITATNTYEPGGNRDDVEDRSGIRITKVLTGDGARWARGPFTFSTNCTLGGFTLPGYPVTTLTPTARVAYVNPVPVGAVCQVVETGQGSASGAVPRLVGTVTAPPSGDPAVEVTATNNFPGGSVQVTKEVSGIEADLLGGAEFELAVTCVREVATGVDETVLDTTVTVGAGRTATAGTGLPIGARCWATETGTGGATTSAVDFGSRTDSAEVTLTDPDVTLTATNTWSTAALAVTKRTTGAAPDGTFGIVVDCSLLPAGGAALALDLTALGGTAVRGGGARFDLAAGATVRLAVPTGSRCSVGEPDARGAEATTVTVDGGSDPESLTVRGATSVTVTNSFPSTEDLTAERQDGPLAFTGGDAANLLLLGGILTAAGTTLTVVGRRRRRR